MCFAVYGGCVFGGAVSKTNCNKWRPDYFKFSTKAINKAATVKVVIKSALKPTVGAVLGATVDQVVSNLIKMQDTHGAAPPFNPIIVMPEIV